MSEILLELSQRNHRNLRHRIINGSKYKAELVGEPLIVYGWRVVVPLAVFIFHLILTYCLEKEMATHSSILAWRVAWMEEPGTLQYMGSQRVGHD